ncbi:unnamed protein product [Closterium sp. NIES-64]|nr:unnamed protein product [Closterium sp. NIES-64]
MEALKQKGNEAFKKGQFSAAALAYRRALEAAAESGEAPRETASLHSNLSCSLLKLGHREEALEAAQQCTELREEWNKGWFRKGEALFALQRYDEAEEAYRQALDRAPDDATVKQCLLLALEAQQGFLLRQMFAGREFCVGRGRNVIESQIYRSAQQMRNFIYLVGDAHSREAVVVDGAWDVESSQPPSSPSVHGSFPIPLPAPLSPCVPLHGGTSSIRPPCRVGPLLASRGLAGHSAIRRGGESEAGQCSNPFAVPSPFCLQTASSPSALAPVASITTQKHLSLVLILCALPYTLHPHLSRWARVVTHYHFDHTGGMPPPPFDALGIKVPGIRELAAAHGLKVYANKHDAALLRSKNGVPSDSIVEVQDGATIEVGAVSLRFIHTPGHTPGSQCIHIERAPGHDDGVLISGDTLFIGSCGRLDLPDCNREAMYDSLQKLAALPPDTRVYPGHDYGGAFTSIGKEKATGFLRPMTKQQWLASQAK